MKRVVVTHKAPDLDAITSVWLIKRFLPGWDTADVQFVPAGQKLEGRYLVEGEPVEKIGEKEVIHVDTGMGALDHHQFQDETKCGASLTYEFVRSQEKNGISDIDARVSAFDQLIRLVLDEDHFQHVFYADGDSYIREFTLVGILDGLKLQYPGQDERTLEFGMQCLDALLLSFVSRVEAEAEMDRGREFDTVWGKGIAFETVNDSVMKIAQLKGYVVVVRLDPSNHLLRIKARPRIREDLKALNQGLSEVDLDLTHVYEELKKRDPYASWFLHASKRMVLNGSAKNPNSIPTKLTLDDVIPVIAAITQ